jgi:peptidoglycan/LPS O-acetylase OafA/YrhL
MRRRIHRGKVRVREYLEVTGQNTAEAKSEPANVPVGQPTHPKYRPDIDGLRAIAVIAVIGFHAFPQCVPGGFVGVDIFFVVSGFLISTIIFGNLQHDRFSFPDFYSRRIRRIFPALLLVLSAVYATGWIALLADEYKQLGKHLAGGAAFVSNFCFWNESGYFDNAADTKPLLHLWSLGIEEQFYIVWPFLLWAAWKRKFNFLAILIAISLISFGINVSTTHSNPVAAFYSPLARFWELLIGSVLANMAMSGQDATGSSTQATTAGRAYHARAGTIERQQRAIRNVRSLLGAVLIGAGLVLITRGDRFPGWWAILPTVGSALVISAGPHAWLNRVVLSNRVFVWCGLISFPLYLWHWPLLAIPRIVAGEATSVKMRALCVAIAIVLASLTFIFVEKPLRAGAYRKTITIGLLVSMVVVGFTGYFTYKYGGLPDRKAMTPVIRNDGDIDHLLFHQYAAREFFPCTPLSLRKDALLFGDTLRCLQSKAAKPIDIAIVGDSHAEHLFLGLAEALRSRNISYYIKTTLPVISDEEFKAIFQYILSDRSIKAVIIAAYWYPKQGMVQKGSTLQAELTATVEELGASGKTVYITDDIPDFPFDPKQCKYSRPFSQKNNCLEERVLFDRQHQNFYPVLQSVVRTHGNAKLLNTAEYFCDAKACSMASAGKVLYRDSNHLNLIGSRYVAQRLVADNPQLAALN